MNIILDLAYIEPGLRQLDVTVDDTPWYRAVMHVDSGFRTNMRINGHRLTIRIAAMPDPEVGK